MAELNGGQIIARQLKRAGIDTMFGVVGGPMIQVFAAAQAEGMTVVNCRHEESAAFAATAWGYIKKKAGVMVAASGPGMTNAITPLYVATESAMPLVVLGGSGAAQTRGLGGFQETDQVALAKSACKWAIQVDSTERIPEYLHLALGRATSGRPGGVYLDFPGNLIANTIDEDRLRYRDDPTTRTAPYPDPSGVEAVAGMLATAKRPLVLVGKGAAWADAGPALTQLVRRGIPFLASPMGRGTLPDDDPMCVSAARSAALSGADAIFMVGGRFNWIFQFGRPPRFAEDVRIAQVDVVAEEFHSAANVEIGIQADAAVTVEHLNGALDGRSLAAESGWLASLKESATRNEAAIAEQMSSDSTPINHYRLVREVRDAISRETAVSVDGEMTMAVARAVLPAYNPRIRLNSGTTGCMGTGVPYAVGAKLANPDQPSVALVGDYAFGAAGMEVETCARVGIPVVFVVSNNGGIAGHSIQDRMFAPDAPPIAALMQAEFHMMGPMVGGFGRKVEDPAEIGPTIKEAIAANTVAVINVITDPKGGRRGSNYLG